jgi:hypothetical protein
MCPKGSSHPALSEEPVPAELALAPELEPVQQQQAPEQGQLRLGLAQEPGVPQLTVQAQELEPVRALSSPRESFSLEIAPAAQVSDFPRVPPERGRLLESQALRSQLVPGWQAAPQVVNKTQPLENQGPKQSELSEIVRSLFHLSK